MHCDTLVFTSAALAKPPSRRSDFRRRLGTSAYSTAGTLTGGPALAVTTPFTAANGQRHLAVIVDMISDPLGRTLRQQMLPAGSTEAVLIDSTNAVVAGARPTTGPSTPQLGAAADAFGADPPARIEPGPDRYIAGTPVHGTPFWSPQRLATSCTGLSRHQWTRSGKSAWSRVQPASCSC